MLAGTDSVLWITSIFIYFYHGSFSHALRFELGGAVLLEAVHVWTVGGHDAVQAGPSRQETLLFSFIMTSDQAHEFTHAVT